MSDSASTRVRQLIATVFDVPEAAVGEDANADTLTEWDSLRHLHLISALEAEFSITFDADEALALVSVAAICDVLAKRGALAGS